MIALASMKIDRFTMEMDILSLRIARRLSIGPVWSRFSDNFTRRLWKARDVSNYRAAPDAQPGRSEGRVRAPTK
jgi:hypothetical protein